MTKSKTYLNFLIVYFILISGISVYMFTIDISSFRMKLYLVSAVLILSISITYILGNKYQFSKKREIDLEKRKRMKKKARVQEEKDEQSWGEVLQNAKKGREI